MSQNASYPANTIYLNGSIPVYANLAAFPATAFNGAMGVASDTLILYVYDTGLVAWTPLSSTSDVIGPGSSVDNALSRWDGTGGDTLQSSLLLLSDLGSLATADKATNVNSSDTGLGTGTVVDGVSGALSLATGAASGTGYSGDLSIGTGNSVGGNSGNVLISVGTAPLGTLGTVQVTGNTLITARDPNNYALEVAAVAGQSQTIFRVSNPDLVYAPFQISPVGDITSLGTFYGYGNFDFYASSVSRLHLDSDASFFIGQDGSTNKTIVGDTSGNIAVRGSISAATAGTGIKIKEGSNAKQGIASLVLGTVTVTNTSITANSRIMLTAQTAAGTVGSVRISATIVGTSFTITSYDGAGVVQTLDISDVAYEIFEPA